MLFNDQIEWDINNHNNSLEEFVQNICKDLGLGTEFVLPNSHSIKKQFLEF